MPNIEIKATIKTTIHVDFPYYYATGDSYGRGGSYETIGRIDEDGTKRCITRRSHPDVIAEWEFSTEKLSTSDYGGYIKPNHDLRCTEGEFNSHLEEMKEAYAEFLAKL